MIAILIAVFLPFFYGIIRVFWIVDQGSMTYALSSFSVYIEICLEILAGFLLIPLFTIIKKNENKKNLQILITTVLIVFFITIILFSLLPPVLNSMQKMNPQSMRKELRIFLILTILASSLGIFEKYLLIELATEEKNTTLYFFTALSILIHFIFDFFLLSKYAVVPFNINNIALSNLIASTIIISFLLILWFISYQNQGLKSHFSKKELRNYYKKGFIPGLEITIRNFFYIFVTLRIVNSMGETQWDSWNLALWVYWGVLQNFTISFEYFLLSERVKNKNVDHQLLTYILIAINFIIYLTLLPIIILFLLPFMVDDATWLSLTIKTVIVLFPFVFMSTSQSNMQTKFIVEDKYYYVLINTLIVNFLILFPAFILLELGVNFSYFANLIIWCSAIFMSFLIALYQFNK